MIHILQQLLRLTGIGKIGVLHQFQPSGAHGEADAGRSQEGQAIITVLTGPLFLQFCLERIRAAVGLEAPVKQALVQKLGKAAGAAGCADIDPFYHICQHNSAVNRGIRRVRDAGFVAGIDDAQLRLSRLDGQRKRAAVYQAVAVGLGQACCDRIAVSVLERKVGQGYCRRLSVHKLFCKGIQNHVEDIFCVVFFIRIIGRRKIADGQGLVHIHLLFHNGFEGVVAALHRGNAHGVFAQRLFGGSDG